MVSDGNKNITYPKPIQKKEVDMEILTTEKMAEMLCVSAEELNADYDVGLIPRHSRINNRRGFILWDRNMVLNSYRETEREVTMERLSAIEKVSNESKRRENVKEWISAMEQSQAPKQKVKISDTYANYVSWSKARGVPDTNIYIQKSFAVALAEFGYTRVRNGRATNLYYYISLPDPN